MTRGQFLAKFKNNTRELIAAVEGSSDLEYDYPHLYKKIYDYYKEKKIYFYNDKEKDYNIIMEEVEYDLMSAGVKI